MRRNVERRRILAALAKLLGTKEDPVAVLYAIDVSRKDNEGTIDEWKLLGRVHNCAMDARRAKRIIFNRGEFLIHRTDLYLDQWDLTVESFLAVFLMEKEKPTMTAKETVVGFAGYLILAGALVALMSATSHVPAADAAFEIFRS